MKLKYSYLILALILLYPIVLGAIFLFNYVPFAVTAPYFALIFILVLLPLILEKRIQISKEYFNNILLLILIQIFVVFNFNSVRYSMPIFAIFCCLSLFVYLSMLESRTSFLNNKILSNFLLFYCILSFLFLGLTHTHMVVGDRYMGFTGSPTTFSGIISSLFILWDLSRKRTFLKRLFVYGVVLLFVFLSKTRLLIIFMILYPFLIFIIRARAMNYSSVFVIVFIVLFFLYPIYDLVVQKFPQMITLRYQDARDASYGLRYNLYQIVSTDFFSGDFLQKLFGKGNEYSRLLVMENKGIDIFPHNDFIRLINDLGIAASSLFFVFLYRIARKNLITLMVSLIYIILFYSNMVFNLFLISILIISYFYDNKKAIT